MFQRLEKSVQKGKVKAIVSDRNQTGLVTQLGENSVKKVRSGGLRMPRVNLGPLFNDQNQEQDDEGLIIMAKNCPTTELTVDNEAERNALVPYKGPITRSKARCMHDSYGPQTIRDTPVIGQMEVSTANDDIESRNMPVLVTGTTSMEEQSEQIRELRRMLVEKDAEVARLSLHLLENMGVGQASGLGQTSASPIPQPGLRTEIRQPVDPIP